jgi:hypothetical protein
LNAASGCPDIAAAHCVYAPAEAGAKNVNKPPEPFSPALFASLAFNMVSNCAESVCRCDQPEDNGREDLLLPFISFALYQRVNLRTANDNSDPIKN